MSLLRDTHRAIVKIVGLLLGFFVVGGAFYTVLDEFNDIAIAEGDPALNTFISWVYPAFYYGYPAVVVFSIILIVLWLYKQIRSKYYATEEVSYYGP